MKNITCWLWACATFFLSCKLNPKDIVPDCDNTTNTCTIAMDFSQTYYYCNTGNYSTTKPPMATSTNYLYVKSEANDIVNVTNRDAYVCQLNVKNDQPAQSACNSAAVLKLYWLTPGVNQVVSTFSHYDSDITIDYYEPNDVCGTGRPYHIGKVGLPAGVTTWTPIPMFTQQSWKP